MADIKKVIIKGSDLDKLYELFENIDFKANDYVPSQDELKLMVKDLVNYGVFLMWIDDTGEITDENQEMHDLITGIIKRYIVVDNDQ